MEDGGLDVTTAPPCEFTVVLPSHMTGLAYAKETNYLLEVHHLSMQAHPAVAHLLCSLWLCGRKIRRFTCLTYTHERAQRTKSKGVLPTSTQNKANQFTASPDCVFTLHIQTLLYKHL